jgi:hypothetical protein
LREVQSDDEEALNPLLVAEYDALKNEDFNLFEKLRGNETFEEKAPIETQKESQLNLGSGD